MCGDESDSVKACQRYGVPGDCEWKSPGHDARAREYYQYKKALIPDILKAYETLSDRHDIVVIEGAGSPAEINLKQDDIVNMGLAQMVKAPVLLVGDIDRGGVFAQLVGDLALLEEQDGESGQRICHQ